MAYELRKLVLDEDRSFLVEILEKNLHFLNGADGVINWHTEKCKYPAKCLTLDYESADGSNKKIGNICTYYRDFSYFGKRVKAGIFGNLVIDEKHRTLQPALKLIKGNAQAALDDLSFLYVFPNDKAIGVFKLAGFKVVSQMTRYACINSYKDFLGEKAPVIGSVSGFFIDVIKNLLFLVGYGFKANNYTSKIENSFPESFNALFNDSMLNKFICNYRDIEYMNWRYIQNPEHEFMILNCYKNHDILVATCVFSVVDNVLFINDIVFKNEMAFDVAIGAIKKWSIKNAIKSMSIRFMGSHVIKDLLKKNGFHERESRWPVVVKTNDSDMLPELVNHNNWFILDGDEDI